MLANSWYVSCRWVGWHGTDDSPAKLNKTSDQSNLTKKLHCCRTWTVQSYSPGGANVHPPSNAWFPGPTWLSIPNCISISAPFLHSSRHRVPILYNGPPFATQNCPFPWVDLDPHLIDSSLGHLNPHPQQHLYLFSHFAGITIVTDRHTDGLSNRPRYSICNNGPHLRCT